MDGAMNTRLTLGTPIVTVGPLRNQCKIMNFDPETVLHRETYRGGTRVLGARNRVFQFAYAAVAKLRAKGAAIMTSG